MSIFPTAEDIRNDMRKSAIIHDESVAIENSVYADKSLSLYETTSGGNSTMTNSTTNDWEEFSQATVVTGTTTNPTVTIDHSIVINTILVTFTGTSLDQVITDITNASITGIAATNSSNQLRLTAATGIDITIANGTGTGLTNLGLTAGINQSPLKANDVIPFIAHGLSNGEIVQFTTSSILPQPLNVDAIYYIIVVDANNFRVATTAEKASLNEYIDILTVGTGTHSVREIVVSQLYYKTWQDIIDDPVKEDQMTQIINYFSEIGYRITREQNPSNTSVFRWRIKW